MFGSVVSGGRARVELEVSHLDGVGEPAFKPATDFICSLLEVLGSGSLLAPSLLAEERF